MTSPRHEFPDGVPEEFHPRLRRFQRQQDSKHTPSEDLVRNHFDQFMRAFAEKHSLTSAEFEELADAVADVCERAMQLARRHDLAGRGETEKRSPRSLPLLREVKGGR